MKINDMPLGSVVLLGVYKSSGNNYIELIWHKVSRANEFMLSERCDYIRYDMPEPHNSNRDRRTCGNSFYPQSNIDQYLNSRGSNWFEKKHEVDEGYNFNEGFLSSFSDSELSLLVPRSIRIAVPVGSRKEHGKFVDIQRIVALASESELGFSCRDEFAEEGARFEYLHGFNESIMTRTAIDASHYLQAYIGDNAPNTFNKSLCRECGYIRPVIKLDDDAEFECGTDGVFYYAESDTEGDTDTLGGIFESHEANILEGRSAFIPSFYDILASIDNRSYIGRYRPGDWVPIKLRNGKSISAMICGIDADTVFGTTENVPLTFLIQDELFDPLRMDTNGICTHGWAESDLRIRLKEFMRSQLPEEILERVVEVKKVSSGFANDGASIVQVTSDDFWVPSARELCADGRASRYVETGGVVYDMFNSNISRMAKYNGATWYWTRTVVNSSNYVVVGRAQGQFSYLRNDFRATAVIGFCIR